MIVPIIIRSKQFKKPSKIRMEKLQVTIKTEKDYRGIIEIILFADKAENVHINEILSAET